MTTCTIADLADDLPSVFSNALVIGDGIPFSEYAKQSAERGSVEYVMSRTDLCEFDLCPSRWLKGYRDEGSDSTRWGQLMDGMVLGPDTKLFAVSPYNSFRTAEAKQWKAAREAQGLMIVKATEREAAFSALREIEADPELKTLILDSRRQVMVTAEYKDAETGIKVPCKCLIDLVPEMQPHGGYGMSLFDFKTAANAAPRPWQKAVFERDYHTQASWYLDLWNAATNEGRDEFRHIIQENFEPWQVAKRFISTEFISIGREKYKRILKRYAECLKTGIFPNYEDRERNMVVNGWGKTEPEAWMMMT